jgi:hypothetical protein
MRTNTKKAIVRTHEGGKASHISPKEELRRTVLSCLLWEGTFYESGVSIGDRIRDLVAKNDPQVSFLQVMDLAIEAREEQHLRHVPLLLMREVVRRQVRSNAVGNALARVIQRPDEISEFLSLYWSEGKCPLANQVKRGLAQAFEKFDEYQLGKWNKDAKIKLRDAIFMVHGKTKDCYESDFTATLVKPVDKPSYHRGSTLRHEDAMAGKLVTDTLAIPDTWETRLSGGADKKQAFTELIKEKKLGYMALLRNLRKMEQVGVDQNLIAGALIDGAGRSRALPFRYVAAARACMSMEPFLDRAMGISLSSFTKLPGRTVIMVDVSGSMGAKLSGKSGLNRMDAAAALAVLVRGVSNDCRVFSFSERLQEVPPRQGMALIDAVIGSQVHYGTYLGAAVEALRANVKDIDRLIVVTDEQAHDTPKSPPASKGYIINVAPYIKGVGYGDWTHINGWSESCVKFIQALEGVQTD